MRTQVGYAGGVESFPVYTRMKDHSEAVLVEYDPQMISYEELLGVFWASHNSVAQEYSRQYRNAVFFRSEAQKAAAFTSLQAVKDRTRYPLSTKVEAAGEFYPAEAYHQKYYLRRRSELLAELQQVHAGESFVATTQAARINGYLGCNGKKDEIERRLPKLGLSPEMQSRLVDYVSANCSKLSGLTCGVPAK